MSLWESGAGHYITILNYFCLFIFVCVPNFYGGDSKQPLKLGCEENKPRSNKHRISSVHISKAYRLQLLKLGGNLMQLVAQKINCLD